MKSGHSVFRKFVRLIVRVQEEVVNIHTMRFDGTQIGFNCRRPVLGVAYSEKSLRSREIKVFVHLFKYRSLTTLIDGVLYLIPSDFVVHPVVGGKRYGQQGCGHDGRYGG